MEWGNDLCLQLIDEYEKYPVLWDPKHDFYFSKIKKHDAWKAIARSLKVQDQLAKRKMCSLMGSFRREKAKWKRSIKTGKGHEVLYNTKWFAFERMQFLLDRDERGRITTTGNTDIRAVSKLAAMIKAERESTSDESDHDQKQFEDVKPSVDAEGPLTNRGQKKKAEITEGHRIDEAFRILNSSTSASALPQDECGIYGQHVGNKLRSYSSRTRALVEHAINNVLFEADMGKISTLDSKKFVS